MRVGYYQDINNLSSYSMDLEKKLDNSIKSRT